jgi:Fe-S cluster assembly protein SufB
MKQTDAREKGEDRRVSTPVATLEALADREYRWGFVSDIEADSIPPGLDEDVIRLISAKKQEPEFMLQWRLRAYRHWVTLERTAGAPKWANVKHPPIDYQAIVYYSAPRRQGEGPASLDEVDPKLLETFEKLGIPLAEQKRLAGVAVDAVFDSVSVATTFKEKLAELGIVFCSFSEAVQRHPELVQRHLGSVVPYTDNFYAALNAAVFSDGSFCYIPRGVRCPMELSTYFRINAAGSGQFERTLIVAEEGSYVSYLEAARRPGATRTSCTPPWSSSSRTKGPRSSIPPCRTGMPVTRRAGAGSSTSSPSAASVRGGGQGSRGRRWRRDRRSPGNIRASSCKPTTRSASSTRWR